MSGELTRDQADDAMTLSSTVQGTLVLGGYDAEACAAIWQEVVSGVEAWLAATRPLPAASRSAASGK